MSSRVGPCPCGPMQSSLTSVTQTARKRRSKAAAQVAVLFCKYICADCSAVMGLVGSARSICRPRAAAAADARLRRALLGVAGLRCYTCMNAQSNSDCNKDGPTDCKPAMDTCQTIVDYFGILSQL